MKRSVFSATTRADSVGVMSRAARSEPRYTSREYFDLVERGLLDADDRVELLEGVIVAMSPQSPRHASAIHRIEDVLRRALGERALVWGQSPLIAGDYSVPEPDVMVLPGSISDYEDAHPTMTLLVVEVADTSLKQDRLTKSAIYAAAGIPEYWIVNLRDDCVEVARVPAPEESRYLQNFTARRGEQIELATLPGTFVAVDALFPGHVMSTE